DKEFVRQHPVLRVAATPNEPPISYFNKNGDFCGISADVMKLLGDKTGFKLDYVPTKSFKQSLTLLKTNQVDMLIGVANDDLKKKNFNLVFSLPYLPLQTVLLHRNGINLQTLNAPVMANLYGFECDAIERCRKETYDTAHEAIHAVKKGKADFTVTSNLAAEHYIINNGKSGFTLVPLPNAKVNLSIALNTPANPTLLTILDRAIYSIDDVQQQSIILKNTSMQKNATLKSVIYANPIPAIIFVVSVGFLLLLLLFLIMNMRLRLSRKSALISDTYRIVGELSDEYILAYDFERETLSFPQHLASQMGISSPIGRDHCLEEGICQLISAFYDRHTDPNFSIEFSCQMMDGRKEMFRAICVIIYENKDKPVRGIGKLVSIQAEFDEKRQLEKMVNTDPLTGLYSKRYCEIWAEDFLKNKNPGGHHALLLIDIDNFKDANDTLGHLGGDEALKYFAGILKAVFTHGEILGRWGGDEFVVFIKDVPDKETLEKKAQELCASSHRAFNYDSASFDLSISVGISFVHDYQNFREIFQAADNALYQIKHDKKNGYQFA
ncbi:MAG: diguanylate cyclase, partial [Anaerovorax sp.]